MLALPALCSGKGGGCHAVPGQLAQVPDRRISADRGQAAAEGVQAAAKENKPLFGEDGKVRGLLEKYDEEEQEAGMGIDATGAVEEAKRKKQEDIRARLRAGILPSCSGCRDAVSCIALWQVES